MAKKKLKNDYFTVSQENMYFLSKQIKKKMDNKLIVFSKIRMWL